MAVRGEDQGVQGVDLRLRRRPVQERGRLRFNQILDSGRALLSEVGVDGFTLEQVATGAGVPIGSVYQFFPNKYALITELSAQDTDATATELREASPRFPAEDWQANVDTLIDHLAALWRRDPTRRHVWLAMQSTAATRSELASQTRMVTDEVVPLVTPLMPGSPGRRVRTVAEVVVQMCFSLLHFSVHDDRPHPDTVQELKRALRSYLRAVALDHSG
jgi:AcrR family transcriptional regulator